MPAFLAGTNTVWPKTFLFSYHKDGEWETRSDLMSLGEMAEAQRGMLTYSGSHRGRVKMRTQVSRSRFYYHTAQRRINSLNWRTKNSLCSWWPVIGFTRITVFSARGDGKYRLVQLIHFIDENTEAQNKKLTCLRSQQFWWWGLV